ncbi:PKD domain-containing protein [Pontibacter sp. G13]|uniref:PKD domain-containing protein n=1 Tax=Pontibacter sp. G13 TaxID=3074898 RepID=UPI00288A627F|nr:PKD domain-containing protein [Pontibacter sp. G13]WNJ18165.1 PKD domain-containing protein [Pontibacter sp. G13]
MNKNIYTCTRRGLYGLFFFLCFGLSSVTAQIFNPFTTTPFQPKDCDIIVVNISGTLNCSNAIINGYATSIVGSNITITMDVTQPLICLGALMPFSQGQNIGTLAAGTYNITLNYVENGTLLSSITQGITVGTCGPTLGTSGAVTQESCPNSMDGAIDLTVTGATSSLSYLWSNGDTTEDLTGLATGSYNVLVTDSLGNTIADTFNVGQGSAPVAFFLANPPSGFVCYGSTVQVVSNSTGATQLEWYSNFNFLGSNSTMNVAMTDTGASFIALIAKDGVCADTMVQLYQVGQPVDMVGTIVDETCPGEADGSIDVAVSPAGTYGYSWSNGAATEDLTGIPTGSYTLTVTDANNCSFSEMFQVATGTPPVADFSTSANLVCPGESVQLTNISTGAVSYEWWVDGAQVTTAMDTVLTLSDEGAHDIVLVALGAVCTDTSEMVVSVSDVPEVTVGITHETCPEDMDGALQVDIVGGAAPVVFTWGHGSALEDQVGLAPGGYALTVTNNDGCVWADSFYVETLGGLTADFEWMPDAMDPYTLDFSDLSDTSAVAWAWDFGDGMTSTDQDPVYTYAFPGDFPVQLIAEDRYGCKDTVEYILTGVSIDDELAAQMEVYPNPARMDVLVAVPATFGTIQAISIMDLAGRTLQEVQPMDNRVNLSVRDLAAGWYLVRVETEMGVGVRRLQVR